MDMAKPTIRFKGYQDDWEQRKLGDIGKARSGVGFPDAEQGGVTGIPFFKVSDMNLDGNENEMTVANNYVTAEQIAVHRWSPITELPAIFFAKVGAAVMLNRKRLCRFPFLLDNNTMAYSLSSTKWDADFAKALFGTVDLTSLVQVGALPSYNARDVESMEIYLPSLLEQEQIGGFFKQLDTLITLHQRKCDETKRLKKYMLQKMFPQNGEKVPEIRFSGFTDDWEQRKVTDLGEIYIGLVTTMTEHYTDKGHLLIRNSDIKDGYFEFGENPIYLDEEFSEQNKSRMHQLGDAFLIYSAQNKSVHTGDIGTSAVIGENEVNSIGFATIVTRPNQEILDSNYFATYLNTDTHKQWAISMATGDGRSNYNLKDYTKLVVPIPEIEEQKKIATCIVNLNSLITLHQRELENLQNIKKFMLGKMFV